MVLIQTAGLLAGEIGVALAVLAGLLLATLAAAAVKLALPQSLVR